MNSISSGPSIDTCFLQQLRRQVNSLDSEIANVVHNILSLDDGEQELMDERSKVKKLLLLVDLKFKRLLHDVECSPKINKTETIGISACLRSVFHSSMETS